MDISLDKIKDYWEYIVSGLICFIVLCVFAFLLLKNSNNVNDKLPSLGNMDYQSTLSTKAFDFLKDKSESIDKNPFKLAIAPPAPVKPAPVKTQTPQPKPATIEPIPVAETPATPETALPDFIQAKLLFKFQGKNSAAKSMAVLQLTLENKSTEMIKLSINDSKYGLKLLDIKENEITIQDAKERKGNIPKGKAKLVWLSNDK